MPYIADFHIHSKYSRATSQNMDLEHLDEWAKIKGIQILGTADFTHPLWFEELKKKLEPLGNGLFQLKKSLPATNYQLPAQNRETYFILTTEVSCIYSKGGRTRRIHLNIFAPDFSSIEKINTHLGWIGNLRSDGRPILGLDAKELVKIVLNASPECLVIPSHIWTPWFSLFGSNSGFDSIEECFEELTSEIPAIETGLSSDPAMNWRLSQLDNKTIISNSDAHSPANLGREANVFEFKNLSYPEIVQAIKEKDKTKLLYTIEFFPEEGKYHFDGHRLCQIRFSPEETKTHHGTCPQCQKPITVGVMNRVDKLADRKAGEKPEGVIPFKSLVPLQEIIAEALGQTRATKAVQEEYQKLTRLGASEFNVLLNLSEEELARITLPEISEGIKRVREGKVEVEPGYDGVYGQVSIFKEEEKAGKQTSFFSSF